MAIDRKRINGNVYSWGSLVAKAGGNEFNGIVGVKYSVKRTRVKQYGTGRHQKPRGRTRGKYEPNASMTLVRGTSADFINFLARAAEDRMSYGDTPFHLTIQYVEDDETPMLVEIFDCVIAGEDSTDDEGNESLKDEFELDVMEIRKNGATLYDARKR